jgi:hypothetical protein
MYEWGHNYDIVNGVWITQGLNPLEPLTMIACGNIGAPMLYYRPLGTEPTLSIRG